MEKIWNEERFKKAVEHTKKMEELYSPVIRRCVQETTAYEISEPMRRKEYRNQFINTLSFSNTDTVSAAFQYRLGRTAILNFASYFSPGGGFIQGAIAQEEALCHESFLYNVLKEQTEFYEKNNRDLNSYLFYNRGMYSKHVLFFRDKVQSFDVITCAAPDYRRAKEFVSNAENSIALLNRIAFIRYLAEMHHVSTLILGAYGCGVFQQDPDEVAQYMQLVFHGADIENVIFAVPGNDRNAKVFRERFS